MGKQPVGRLARSITTAADQVQAYGHIPSRTDVCGKIQSNEPTALYITLYDMQWHVAPCYARQEHFTLRAHVARTPQLIRHAPKVAIPNRLITI